MIRPDSDEQKLVARFLHQQTITLEAVRAMNTSRANRHQLKAWEASERLAATESGRRALEGLLTGSNDYIRAKVAGLMMLWAPDRAIPILGKYLDADLSHIGSPDERLDIRLEAKDWLYRHFGIRSADRNDLIEPLKAYGVELSFIDRSSWPEYR